MLTTKNKKVENQFTKDLKKVREMISDGSMLEMVYDFVNSSKEFLENSPFITVFWSRSEDCLYFIAGKGYKIKMSYGAYSNIADYIPVLSLTNMNIANILGKNKKSDNLEKEIKSILQDKMDKNFVAYDVELMKAQFDYSFSAIGTEFNIPIDYYPKNLLVSMFQKNRFDVGNCQSFPILDDDGLLYSGLESVRYFAFEIFADIILDRDGSVLNLPLKRVVTFLHQNYNNFDYRWEELNAILASDFETNYTKIVIDDLRTLINKTGGLLHSTHNHQFNDEMQAFIPDMDDAIKVFLKSSDQDDLKRIYLQFFKEFEKLPVSWFTFLGYNDRSVSLFNNVFNVEESPILNCSIQTFNKVDLIEVLSLLKFKNGIVLNLFGINGLPYIASLQPEGNYYNNTFCYNEKLDLLSIKDTILYTTKKQNKLIDFYLKNFSLTNDVRDTLLGVKSLPLVPWKK
jgi:hypothetical protein